MAHLLHPYPLLFESGDCMSREEFLARWEQMPEVNKADLIDGVVYMPSPVSKTHGRFDAPFHILMERYAEATPGCEWLPNVTWLMLESAPQSDIALYILPEYGGRTGEVDDLAAGSPELVVEVAKSSRTYDLGPKLALYQRAGVLEYIAALVEERRIEWRVLEAGSYRLMRPDSDGILRSRVFPGLWLDSAAFWHRDKARLLAVLEEGQGSEEHARFVERLQRR